MVWGLYSLPHLFPAKCMDLTDVANYLGKKYGGWAPAAEAYGKSGNKWIGIPVATTGGLMNYRISSMEKAGFKEFPKDTAGFLELVQGAQEEQHAGRLRARPRLGRRQHLAALGAVGAWRQPGRQERQGHHQLAGDREGARIRQGAVRDLHPRHGVVERLVQQQDLRAGDLHLTVERHLDLRGRAEGEQGGRRRHEPRLHADRPGRQADRAASRLPDPDLQLHQGAAGLQGAHRVHAGSGKLQPVGRGGAGLPLALPARPTTTTRSGPPIRSARPIATSPSARSRPAGWARSARRRRRRSPTSSWSTCSRTSQPAARTPRARSRWPSGRRSASIAERRQSPAAGPNRPPDSRSSELDASDRMVDATIPTQRARRRPRSRPGAG